jgi:ariadne-2
VRKTFTQNIQSKIKPDHTSVVKLTSNTLVCPIFTITKPKDVFCGIGCSHLFCKGCWNKYLETKIMDGVFTGRMYFWIIELLQKILNFFIIVRIATECMGCSVIATEDFVLSLLAAPQLKERYVRHAFSDYVKSHPEMKFCPGLNCKIIIRAKENKGKRIVCSSCKTTFWYFSVFINRSLFQINVSLFLVFDVEANTTHPLTV